MIARNEIEKLTRVMYVEKYVYRFEILEALIINAEVSKINRLDTGKKRIHKFSLSLSEHIVFLKGMPQESSNAKNIR